MVLKYKEVVIYLFGMGLVFVTSTHWLLQIILKCTPQSPCAEPHAYYMVHADFNW
jgi:hypothetical protein